MTTRVSYFEAKYFSENVDAYKSDIERVVNYSDEFTFFIQDWLQFRNKPAMCRWALYNNCARLNSIDSCK